MSRSILDRLAFSRTNYWLGFALDTGASLALVAAGIAATPHRWPQVGGALLAGVALFSLYEYALHRWLYHALPTAVRRIHARHHAEPDVLVGAPFFFSLGVCGATWGLARLALGDATAAILAGVVLLAYAYHGAVHHLIHARRFTGDRGLGRLQRAHLLHHRSGRANFGVTTTFWDRVFGTHEG